MLKNLKEMRLKCKLTEKALGEKVGTTQQNISKYEMCLTQPDLVMAGKLADALNTSIDYLAGRTDVDKPIEHVTEEHLNKDEMTHITKYRALDKTGKQRVKETTDWFYPR